MKILILPLFLFTTLMSAAQEESSVARHTLYDGQLVSITMDRALYNTENSDIFCFKINITNKSDQPVGIELDDYWGVLYVSQWVIHKSGKMKDVLEHQYEPEALTARVRDHLIWKFRMEKMVMLKPGETTSYYRPYDNGTKDDLDLHFGEVATFLIDGQLFVTNGRAIENINILDEETLDRQVDIPYPIEFFPVPKDGRLMKEDQGVGPY